MKSFRALDVVLGVVIAGSLGFIGMRFFSAKEKGAISTNGPSAGGESAVTVVPNQQVKDAAIVALEPWGIPYGMGGQQVLAKTTMFDAATWSALVAAPDLQKLRRTQTDTCADQAMPVSHGLSIVVPDLLQGIQEGRSQFHIAPYRAYCSKVGDKFKVIRFSELANEPYAKLIGQVTVQDILQANLSQLSEEFLKAMGIIRGELVSALKSRADTKGSDLPISIFKYGAFEALANSGAAPVPTYFRYPVLDPASFSKWKAKYEGKYKVIDVRSAEESEAKPIPGAIRIPFELPAKLGNKSGRFSWSVTVADLDASKFEVLVALQSETRATQMLVVGSDPQDGRPFWALREMLRAGMSIAWFYEGSEKLIPLLTSNNPK